MKDWVDQIIDAMHTEQPELAVMIMESEQARLTRQNGYPPTPARMCNQFYKYATIRGHQHIPTTDQVLNMAGAEPTHLAVVSGHGPWDVDCPLPRCRWYTTATSLAAASVAAHQHYKDTGGLKPSINTWERP